MSNTLSTAVNGINSAVARATQSANNIANASLTGKNVDTDVVAIKQESLNIAANAAVIKAEHKNHKALLDIKV